jgi:hypothetical protein
VVTLRTYAEIITQKCKKCNSLRLRVLAKLCYHKVMKKHKLNEYGFIPLLLSVLAVVIAIIYFAFTRVMHAQQ